MLQAPDPEGNRADRGILDFGFVGVWFTKRWNVQSIRMHAIGAPPGSGKIQPEIRLQR
jgi:hypothetical protein